MGQMDHPSSGTFLDAYAYTPPSAQFFGVRPQQVAAGHGRLLIVAFPLPG
jgi:hypothetical protein